MTKRNIAGKIALGVTGVALTAGVVAAGRVLSDKKNRLALKRGARKANKKLQQVREAIDEGKTRYQAFAHKVSMVGKKSRLGLGKGKKKKKRIT